MNVMWFGCGILMGLVTLSLAMGSVPKNGSVTNDTAIYQNLSEINIAHERDLNFDSDISRLAEQEHRYHERVSPLARHPHLIAPMKRVSETHYQYRGKHRKAHKVHRHLMAPSSSLETPVGKQLAPTAAADPWSSILEDRR